MRLLILTLLVSCGPTKQVEKPAFDLSKVREYQASRIADAQPLLDEKGRMDSILEDCDGYLWQAKWCSVTGCDMSDYEEDGRLYRRPAPRCWEGQDNGSKTTWSKDMAACGFIPYALLRNDKDLMKRHVEYGRYNGWRMGEPQDSIDALSRVVYTPSLVSLIRSAKDYLEKGEAPRDYLHYTQSGLTDYKAHLQSCKIWAKLYMNQGYKQAEVDVIKAHHERVPGSPFYSLLYAYLTKDYSDIIEKCESDDNYAGDYVRCNDSSQCAIIEKTFSCELLLRGNNG